MRQSVYTSRHVWTALLLLSLGSFLNFLDRMLISVVSIEIKEEFHLTDTQYGMLTGLAFMGVYALTTLGFGWLADRKPRHIIMSGALLVWSCATIACAFASSYIALLIARTWVAAGEGSFSPASYSYLSERFPPARRAWALSILQGAGMVGILASFAIGGLIAAHYGWRAAFLLAGVPGIIIAGLVYFKLFDDRRTASPSGVSENLTLRETLKILSHNRAYLWIIGGGSLSLFANMGILPWWPLFFSRTHQLSLTELSLLFGPILTIGMIVGVIAGGWISSRLAHNSLARPLLICVWANIIIPPLTWLTLIVPSAAIALSLTFLCGLVAISFGPTYGAAVQNCCAPNVRSTASALMTVVNAIMGFGILPFLVGVLSDAGASSLGADSLRVALAIVICANLFAAAGFYKGYRIVQASESA